MRKFLIVPTLLVFTSANADHFNTRNLLSSCNQDTSFDSVCFTYIAAYKDLLGFIVTGSPEKKKKMFCLSNVPTTEIVNVLREMQHRSSDRAQIADFLISEFC